MRVHYTTRRKRGLIATSKRMMAEGMTLRAAASELCVSVTNLSRWTLQGMGEIDRLDNGTLLPSTLIFKGKPDGRIAKKEFPSSVYPATHFYKCQEDAWMDEEVMIAWVNEVLAPYVATALDHVVPILILDMYRCHMMPSVVQMIQELGVEVQHIPGGCTSLCQPVDVGFNKPFKDRMRRQWMN